MGLKRAYYARLSGDHPTLPAAELRAVVELASSSYYIRSLLDLVALFEATDLDHRLLCSRLAYTKSLGVLIGLSEQDQRGITAAVSEALEPLGELAPDGIRVEVHRVRGYARDLDPGQLAKRVASVIEGGGLRATPSRATS